MPTTHHSPSPALAMNLRAIDWILGRLAQLQRRYPDRAAELARRVDDALDERLRLMRLRDGATPFPNHEQN